MDASPINPTPEDDSTLTYLKSKLERADTLLSKVETLQNGIAHAKRRYEAGLDVDLKNVEASAQHAIADVARQVKGFSSRQESLKILDVSSQQVAQDYWSHIGNRKETIPTGLSSLNEALSGGLEPQRLVVLLGAPGGGKTTLANQIAVYAANAGRPVLYVTSEDVPFALLAKTIARQGQIEYKAVLKGYESERTRIDAALQEYQNSQSAQRLRYLDASMKIDIDVIREHAQAHFEQYKDAGQGVLMIDYLQRLARAQNGYRAGTQDLRQAVTVLTEQLKEIALEVDCCVLALAAQHRASGYGAASNSLSSAKESGDIEYTADVMMVIGDDEDRVPPASWLRAKVLKIDKNRQGDIGHIGLDWYPVRQQFTCAAVDDTVVSSNGSRKRGYS